MSHLHDIGTLDESSGQRLGGLLWGIDTPTLRGVWRKEVFLHNGSAVSLEAVFEIGEADSPHGIVRGLPSDEQADLMTYVRSLDGTVADEPGHEAPRRRVTISVQHSEVIFSISPQHGYATDPTNHAEFGSLSDHLNYTLGIHRPPGEDG